MEINKENILKDLEGLYFLLRDDAYPDHANEIKKVISYLLKEDFFKFKKMYKSAVIWGGAGSIMDIDFRNELKNNKRDNVLRRLKLFKNSMYSPWWKFW